MSDHWSEEDMLQDYDADIYRRVIETRGGAGQGLGTPGPLAAPIIEKPGSETTESMLRNIRDLLIRLPEALILAARIHFLLQPREGLPWCAPAPNTALGAGPGVSVVVASFTMDERFTGAITGIGVNVTPAGSFPDISWDLLIGAGPFPTVVPGFSGRVFGQNTYNNPDPFTFELVQSRTISLRATNNAAAPVSVSGIMVGWREFMGGADYKPYGADPKTGIG